MNTINITINYKILDKQNYEEYKSIHPFYQVENFQIINTRLGHLEFNWMGIKRELT